MTQTTQTGAARRVRVPPLPPGTYTVKVELSGFKTVEKQRDPPDQVRRSTWATSCSRSAASARRSSSRRTRAGLQIQSESAERSDLVTNKQLRDIALNGRNIADLFKTIPGVIAGSTITTSTVQNVVGSFTINGTRSNQHEYTVDGVTNLNLGNNTGALVTDQPRRAAGGEDPHLELPGRIRPRRAAASSRSPRAAGTNEYHGGAALLPAQRGLQRQQLLQQRQRPAASRPTASTTTAGTSAARCPSSGTKDDRKVFFFLAQEYYDQQTPAANPTNVPACPPPAERSGDFSQTADGNGRPVVDPRSPHRPALPRQRHPVRPLRSRACRRCCGDLPAAQRRRRRRPLQLHVAAPARHPAPRGHRARRLADRERHAAERALHPQQG